MNLIQLTFIFIAYTIFLGMVNSTTSSAVSFPTFDSTADSCNVVTLCINVPVSVLLHILTFLVAIGGYLIAVQFNGFGTTAPGWLNVLAAAPLLISIGVIGYKLLRSGSDNA